MDEDKFTKNQIDEFREVFNIFDKTNNGYITKKDINTVLKSLGQDLSPEDLITLMECIQMEDQKNDDNIYFRHFLTIIATKVGKKDGKKDLIEAFKVFDRESCGKLSILDLRYLLASDKSIQEEEINNLFLESDPEEEGFVEYNDYLDMILWCFK